MWQISSMSKWRRKLFSSHGCWDFICFDYQFGLQGKWPPYQLVLQIDCHHFFFFLRVSDVFYKFSCHKTRGQYSRLCSIHCLSLFHILLSHTFLYFRTFRFTTLALPLLCCPSTCCTLLLLETCCTLDDCSMLTVCCMLDCWICWLEDWITCSADFSCWIEDCCTAAISADVCSALACLKPCLTVILLLLLLLKLLLLLCWIVCWEVMEVEPLLWTVTCWLLPWACTWPKPQWVWDCRRTQQPNVNLLRLISVCVGAEGVQTIPGPDSPQVRYTLIELVSGIS